MTKRRAFRCRRPSKRARATLVSRSSAKIRVDDFGDRLSKRDRHRIADLPCYVGLGATPAEVQWESLDASGLEVSNWPGVFRVKITTLFGLEEFGTDGHRRLAQSKSPHDVASTGVVVVPTFG